jgi:hypothetical protein
MKKKIVVIAALVFAAGAIGVGTFVSSRAPQRKLEAKADPPPQGGGLEQPSAQIERPVAPSETPSARPTPPPAAPVVVTRPAAARPAVAVHEKAAPVRIYTAASYTVEAPKLESKEEDPAPYAPSGRLLRCKLVNTLDSGDIQTPIIGTVTDDLKWGGETVIPRCSEVHGKAQIGQNRDRIVSEGAWTVVFQDGRELVLKGIALDRGYDPAFKTYAISEGSAGILGSVIRTDNAAEIKLFVATFISGVAQGLKGTTSGLLGNYENPNARGAGGLPGYVMNPTATATQSVLDQYAQRVVDGILKDGYYLVIPSQKQFLVYVDQDIDLSKAVVNGARSRGDVQAEFLRDRKVEEEVTQPRSERDAAKAQNAQNAFPGVPAYPQMDQMAAKVESASNRLEARSKALGKRVDELNAQAEAQP